MYRGVTTVLAVLFAFTCLACKGGEGGEDYARQQAELVDKDKLGKSVKIQTALPAGVQVACDKLFDPVKLTELLKEKEQMTIVDQSAKSPDTSATCSLRRGGEPMSEKEQARIVEKGGRLGVLGGDEMCNVEVYCSVPADVASLQEKCKAGNMLSNESIGVFACVKVTPKGADDGYTYQFIDEDSKCNLRVRGGPSVVEESIVQECSKAVMALMTPEALQGAGEAGEAGEQAKEQEPEQAKE